MSGHHYDRQLDEIRRREKQLFADCARQDAPSTGLMAKVEARIPSKLVGSMDEAFYLAFQMLFDKGTRLLRLTFSEKRLRAERYIREYYLKEDPNAERVRSFHKSARSGGIVNTVLATVEGFVMGLFGMGLPDIPVLMSLLLRTVYTTALRYGYRFDNPRERYYILLVLSAALTKGRQRKEFSQKADRIGQAIDSGVRLNLNLEEQMRETSKALARSMLVVKFIQTTSIIGVVGGVQNFAASRKVAVMANLKYQKRFLLRKKAEK